MILNRFVGQVVDIGDKVPMTITSEWTNGETVRVLVLKEGKIPMFGESTLERLLAECPRDPPQDKCLTEMQEELSGRCEGVQFILRDGRLQWKKKGWWKGKINIQNVEDILTLADMSMNFLREQAKLLHTNSQMQQDFENLQTKASELEAKLKTAELLKKTMEDELYKRFILVLNEKKKKIRELEERLKTLEDDQTVLYNAETYDSETESRSEKLSEINFPSTSRHFEEPNEPRPESQESEQNDMVLRFEDSQDFSS